MLTPNEKYFVCTTRQGTLKISVNKMPDGRYRVDSTFFDNEGYYRPDKSNTRYANNIDELTI